jgi:hypothetical protein
MIINLSQRHRLVPQDLAGAYPKNWDVILSRQQEIYDELMANHELDSKSQRTVQAEVAMSVEDLTRDLLGWSPQWAA